MSEWWSRLLGIDRVNLDAGTVALDWHHPLPAWAVLLVVAPAIAGSAWLLYRHARGRFALAALRASLFLLLFLVLMGPVLTVETLRQRRGTLVVMVDRSRSMQSREESARRALGPAFGRLEERFDVACFPFARTASRGDEPFAPCDGDGTAIGDSLRAAMRACAGKLVVGVVLVSDGANRSGADPAAVAAELADARVPVTAILAGDVRPRRDVALVELEAPPVVVAGDEVVLRFGARVDGYGEKDVDVEFDGRTVRVRAGETGEVRWKAAAPGERELVLRAPPRPDEETERNNALVHRIRVVDERVRVLLVEHWPRWEFRYLRNLLVRDPKVLCHTLLTGADEDFTQDHTRETDDAYFREPLRTFPSSMDDLLRYDVIMLGDVNPNRLGGPETWTMIERFVADHGRGLVFIAGPRFDGTPLAGLLPVVPAGAAAPESGYEEPPGYRVTEEGRTHPIARFAAWPDLPRVFAAQGVERVKPSAVVLVERAGVPLFVAAPAGAGRVFWSGTDETWRWRRLSGDEPCFAPFWRQAIAWCRNVRASAGRLRLRVDRDDARYAFGEEVRLTATAFDERWEPLAADGLEIAIDLPEGGRLPLTLRRSRPGHFAGSFVPAWPGVYRAGPEPFVVLAPPGEADDPLDAESLRRIAHASHEASHAEAACPAFAALSEAESRLDALPDARYTVAEVREDDLWDSPVVYLLFALLITVEWILRKALRLP